MFVTESMIMECCGDKELVEAAAILEGAKFDMALKNFLKEGEDYKGLKKELKEIIKANDMSEEGLKSKGRGFMHICKRILQINQDLGIATGTFSVGKMAAQGIMSGNPAIVIGAIAGYIIGFIINRLLRFLYDTAEFNAILSDSEEILSNLKTYARRAEEDGNTKLAEKYKSEANRLEKAIKKYSSK